MRWILWLLVACSGGGKGEPQRPLGSASTPDAGVAESGPSEKECEALLGHVAELGARDVKSDPPPTADDRKKVAGEVSPQFMPGCRTSTRAGYHCAMDAKSLADVAKCKSR